MRRLPLIVLLAVGCATSHGSWSVAGGTLEEHAQAVAIEAAAERVTPDRKGWLAQGGVITLLSTLDGICPVPTAKSASGCSAPMFVWVLWPHPKCPAGADLTCSALAHELCHLGLERGGGVLGGAVNTGPDDQADACALLVNQEYRSAPR